MAGHRFDPLASVDLTRYHTGWRGRECDPGPCGICVLPLPDEPCSTDCVSFGLVNGTHTTKYFVTGPLIGIVLTHNDVSGNWEASVQSCGKSWAVVSSDMSSITFTAGDGEIVVYSATTFDDGLCGGSFTVSSGENHCFGIVICVSPIKDANPESLWECDCNAGDVVSGIYVNQYFDVAFDLPTVTAGVDPGEYGETTASTALLNSLGSLRQTPNSFCPGTSFVREFTLAEEVGENYRKNASISVEWRFLCNQDKTEIKTSLFFAADWDAGVSHQRIAQANYESDWIPAVDYDQSTTWTLNFKSTDPLASYGSWLMPRPYPLPPDPPQTGPQNDETVTVVGRLMTGDISGATFEFPDVITLTPS